MFSMTCHAQATNPEVDPIWNVWTLEAGLHPGCYVDLFSDLFTALFTVIYYIRAGYVFCITLVQPDEF